MVEMKLWLIFSYVNMQNKCIFCHTKSVAIMPKSCSHKCTMSHYAFHMLQNGPLELRRWSWYLAPETHKDTAVSVWACQACRDNHRITDLEIFPVPISKDEAPMRFNKTAQSFFVWGSLWACLTVLLSLLSGLYHVHGLFTYIQPLSCCSLLFPASSFSFQKVCFCFFHLFHHTFPLFYLWLAGHFVPTVSLPN